MKKQSEVKDSLSQHLLENQSPFHDGFEKIVTHSDIDELYAAVLTCQTRILSETILTFLAVLPHWQKVKNILDVGCGTGEVAKQLDQHALLEHKSYTGIDISEYFIKRAQKQNQESDIRFVCTDISDFQEQGFDIVLLISVLQHLGDVEKAMLTLLPFIKKNGYFFFFDTLPGLPVKLQPQVPLILEMFERISYQHTLGKRNDQCLIELAEKAPHLGLTIVEKSVVEVLVAPHVKEDYVRLSFFTSELVKRFYAVSLDQKKLLDQLLFWIENQGTAVMCGLGKVVLTRSS